MIDYAKFMDECHAGRRPTLGELRGLSKIKYKGFEQLIISEHHGTQAYVKNIIEQLQIEQDDINQIVMDIQDKND